jgi:hypothetical protein
MLKKISATALFAVLALTLSLPALADTHKFKVINDCEMDVKVLYHDGTKIVKQDFDTCKYDLKMSY